MLIFPLPNVANILILLAYGSKSSTSQKQSKSMGSKLKTTEFGWPLGTTIQTIFYLGPICCGHWLPITITHTLIPAQPPLPVFSFLLPVVPPECMPELQLSTAKSQKLMQEKETAICKKELQKTCSAERWWNIVTCICTVLQFEQKWDLAPDAGVILIVFFVASICPQDAMWLSAQTRKFPKVGDSIPAAAPLLQLFLLVLVQPSNMQHSPSHRLKLDFF